MIDKIFHYCGVKHPHTRQTDVLLSLVVFVVIICGIKFLFDGATIQIFGHLINFGHVDSMSYGTMLAPMLGAHGYVATKPNPVNTYNGQVDSPDE